MANQNKKFETWEDVLRKQIRKDWNCDCAGEFDDHTYSKNTSQWAEEVMKYAAQAFEHGKQEGAKGIVARIRGVVAFEVTFPIKTRDDLDDILTDVLIETLKK